MEEITDEKLAEELEVLVYRLNEVIFKAEMKDLLVKIEQQTSYHVTMGNKPTSFLTLKVSKSLLKEPSVYFTGSH